MTALGSYLQARKQKGKWLIRMEDIDEPRTRPGTDKIILKQLECLGLLWDGEIVYQSQRTPLYRSAFEYLNSLGLIFRCTCTRKEIANRPYPGTCRHGVADVTTGYSMRIKTNDDDIACDDVLQGKFVQSIASEVGDFIIKRADGLFAYHLAVTVDDAEQGINEIVRGADLLDSTPRQIYLQTLLGYNLPGYLHLPVAINNDGNKISKRSHAAAIDHDNPSQVIFEALDFLGHAPPYEAMNADIESLLDWAVKNWDLNTLPKQTQIKINHGSQNDAI